MCTPEKHNTSPLCILCTPMPNITIYYTHLAHMWHDESIPKGAELNVFVLGLFILRGSSM